MGPTAGPLHWSRGCPSSAGSERDSSTSGCLEDGAQEKFVSASKKRPGIRIVALPRQSLGGYDGRKGEACLSSLFGAPGFAPARPPATLACRRFVNERARKDQDRLAPVRKWSYRWPAQIASDRSRQDQSGRPATHLKPVARKGLWVRIPRPPLALRDQERRLRYILSLGLQLATAPNSHKTMMPTTTVRAGFLVRQATSPATTAAPSEAAGSPVPPVCTC
jgi:hypothetical protein